MGSKPASARQETRLPGAVRPEDRDRLVAQLERDVELELSDADLEGELDAHARTANQRSRRSTRTVAETARRTRLSARAASWFVSSKR